MGSEGHLGTSLGQWSEGRFWVNSGSILRPYLTLSQETSGNLIILLHLAVGRGLKAKYTEYWVWVGGLVVPGIALLSTHPHPHHPGYTTSPTAPRG